MRETTISRLFAEGLGLASVLERKGACLDAIDALPLLDRSKLAKEYAAIDRSYDRSYDARRKTYEAMTKARIKSELDRHMIAFVADGRAREDDGGYSADLARRLRKRLRPRRTKQPTFHK
jgi:hypothetical protein